MQELLDNTDMEATLIVPEQQTVVWETKIAELLPDEQLLRVEVTNFTRLANAVFREYGGLAANRCDDGGRTLILWRAMLSVWDGLTVYNRGLDGREDKNLPTLTAAVGEMKQNGVTPLALEEAAYRLEQQDGESELTRRLYDLSLIYSAYEELLHEEYCDRHDVMNALCEALEGAGGGYFDGKVCFVDSFFSLTVQQKRIVRSIMKRASEVDVTFSCDPEDAGEIQFGEVRAYFDSMTRIAGEILSEQNAELSVIRLKKDLRHAEGSMLSQVEKRLFSFSDAPDAESVRSQTEEENPAEKMASDSVRVIRCADRYEEAELCASIIEKLTREGSRYADIAVVARNMAARSGVVDTALRRHGIPCFISERSALAQNPAVRLFVSLLDVQSNGWQRRDVVRLLKTGLTPLADYECDLFEEYVATWNIRGRRLFAEEEEWSMNPEGYRREVGAWAEKTLTIVNEARRKLVPPILNFCRIFDKKEGSAIPDNQASVRDICAGLVQYALETEMYSSLMKTARELASDGYAREAEQTRQIWGAICAALDKMVLILGDMPLDAGRFCGLFTGVYGSMDVGTIPTGMDEVVLGSSDGVRFREVEHMIILGSVEGEFPGTAEDAGFFCDADKLKLANVGISLSNDTELRTAQEYFMYYRTACLAKKSLTALAPTSEGELSQGAARLRAIFGDEIVSDYGDTPVRERMYHPSSADYAVAYETGATRRLLERLSAERSGGARFASIGVGVSEERVSREVLDRLFGGRITLSQSKLDRYVNCPFAYWCRYVMNLRESPKAEIAAPDVGVFVHGALEQFFIATAGMDYPLSRERTEQIADGIIRDYVESLGGKSLNGRLRYLFVRLRRNVLCFLEAIMEELAQSEFVPVAFELPIGIREEGKPSVDALSFRLDDGSEILLRGVADRVDLYRDGESGRAYVRVVDYKTGAKTFSMEDIRLGLNAQLLVYLFSLWKGNCAEIFGEAKVYPAGAAYYSARPGDLSSERMLSEEEARELVKANVKRTGIFLADEGVLNAMNGTGNYFPVKKMKDLVTMEEFGKLYGELEKTIVRIGAEIRDGVATAAPLARNGKSPCEYCSHYPICRRGG